MSRDVVGFIFGFFSTHSDFVLWKKTKKTFFYDLISTVFWQLLKMISVQFYHFCVQTCYRRLGDLTIKQTNTNEYCFTL